jgi:hypothetical protein
MTTMTTALGVAAMHEAVPEHADREQAGAPTRPPESDLMGTKAAHPASHPFRLCGIHFEFAQMLAERLVEAGNMVLLPIRYQIEEHGVIVTATDQSALHLGQSSQ